MFCLSQKLYQRRQNCGDTLACELTLIFPVPSTDMLHCHDPLWKGPTPHGRLVVVANAARVI
jgi:hypothetical protein